MAQPFQPDWASPPGATIADLMKARNCTAKAFAAATHVSLDQVGKLLAGVGHIDESMATQLSALFGVSTSFWMTREEQYRRDIAASLSRANRNEIFGWLEELPVKDMLKFGWIEDGGDAEQHAMSCLAFFGVSSVSNWRKSYGDVLGAAAFRTSPTIESTPGTVAAWLREGEIRVRSIDCAAWNAAAFRAALGEIRALTRNRKPQEFLPALQELCARCGVASVVCPAPRGCRASGATKFLDKNKALILLSFRFLSDDHFWFSFFHEAAHLLLHGSSGLFLEGTESPNPEAENEANEFASNFLIPPEYREAMFSLAPDAFAIARFAKQLGVSAGIVVGQLQHFGKLPRNHFNNLKARYEWADS